MVCIINYMNRNEIEQIQYDMDNLRQRIEILEILLEDARITITQA